MLGPSRESRPVALAALPVEPALPGLYTWAPQLPLAGDRADGGGVVDGARLPAGMAGKMNGRNDCSRREILQQEDVAT